MQHQSHSSHPQPQVAAAAATYMPGFDLYGAVHKGLRWALASLLTRMGSVSASEPAAVQMALDDLEGVLYMFASHAEHEDRHLNAALNARSPGAAASLDLAHARQEHMISELRALSSALSTAPKERAPALLRALYLRFAAFAGENLVHMSEEEEVAQPLFETLYTGEELARIQSGLLAGIGPEEMLAFLRVMAAGASREDRIALLQRMKGLLPKEAFGALLAAVRKAIGEADYGPLAERLAA
jgi:hypothetical protein